MPFPCQQQKESCKCSSGDGHRAEQREELKGCSVPSRKAGCWLCLYAEHCCGRAALQSCSGAAQALCAVQELSKQGWGNQGKAEGKKTKGCLGVSRKAAPISPVMSHRAVQLCSTELWHTDQPGYEIEARCLQRRVITSEELLSPPI